MAANPRLLLLLLLLLDRGGANSAAGPPSPLRRLPLACRLLTARFGAGDPAVSACLASSNPLVVGSGGSAGSCSRASSLPLLFVPLSGALAAAPDARVALTLTVAEVSKGAHVRLGLHGLGVRDNATDVRPGDYYVGPGGGPNATGELLQADFIVGAGLANGDRVGGTAGGALGAYLRRLVADTHATAGGGRLRFAALRLSGSDDFGCATSCGADCAIRRLKFESSSVALTFNASGVLDPATGRTLASHQSRWVQARCTATGSVDLTYVPDAMGNTVPDFSSVGYRGGEDPLPDAVPTVRTAAAAEEGDDTTRLQALLDDIAAMPLDPSTGFRGALALGAGTFRVNATLRVEAGGIVVRGQGAVATTVLSTSRVAHDVLFTAGSGSRMSEVPGTRVAITDAYVPAGRNVVGVADGAGFAVGDRVVVERGSNADWIASIGMDSIPDCSAPDCAQWSAASYVLKYERSVVEVRPSTPSSSSSQLVLDVPLVHPIQSEFGGGAVYRVAWSGGGRLANVGFEDLKLESVFEAGQEDSDEDHAFTAVELNEVEHSWVRRVQCWHFASHCVDVAANARHVTVKNCSSFDPVSLITGGRRYSFNVDGALTLVTGCTTRNGRHDYVTGSKVPGPNVFHDCRATEAHSDIGPHHRYATGLLFDRVEGGDSRVWDRGNMGSGHGWSGAFTLFWNGVARAANRADGNSANINVASPSGAVNWGVGTVSDTLAGTGVFDTPGLHVFPNSLYASQLAARLRRPYEECVVVAGPGPGPDEHDEGDEDALASPAPSPGDRDDDGGVAGSTGTGKLGENGGGRASPTVLVAAVSASSAVLLAAASGFAYRRRRRRLRRTPMAGAASESDDAGDKDTEDTAAAWQSAVDPASGRPYYYTDKRTTWTRPAAFVSEIELTC